MRAIRVQYADSSVDFDVYDELLRSNLNYLSAMFQVIY